MRFNLKIASFVVAAVMAVSGIRLFRFSAVNTFCASAQAFANSAAAEDVTVGIGETNKATVQVSGAGSVTLTLGDVPYGQYYLIFKRTSPAADYYLPVTVLADENYVYPAYNSYKDAFIALVLVNPDSRIILTGNGNGTVSGEVYLESPFIGESTGYSVNNLLIGNGLSGVLRIADVEEGHYTVALTTYEELGEYDKFYFRLGNAAIAEMEYDANTDTFYAEAEITASVKSLEVVTNIYNAVAVNVHMSASPRVDNSLPVDSPETFTQYETLSFVYRQTRTGYYTISSHSEPSGAEFSITLKTYPDDPYGEIIADGGYPFYMVEGKNYYFDITYFGVAGFDYGNMPENVSAYFSVNGWIKPDLSVKETVYVPVTNAADTKTVPLKISGSAGTAYNISFNGVPFEAEQIYVNYADSVFILDAITNFTGQITVEKGYDSVYFTSDCAEFVSDITLTYIPPVYDGEIKTEAIKKITLRAYESLGYYIDGLPAGEYKISVIQGNGGITVSDFYENIIVANGESFGYINTETDGTYNLRFINDGNSDLTFSVLIYSLPATELVVGEESQLTVGGNASLNCEILFEINIYTITLEYDPESVIYVYLDGELFIRAGATYGEFFITLSGTHILSFENGSDNEAIFSVIIGLYS